jgi:uncharacterized protein (DUF58 family)
MTNAAPDAPSLGDSRGSSSRPVVSVVTTSALATFGSLCRFAAVEALRARHRSRPVAETITRLGWLIVTLVAAAWVSGALLGWKELLLAAAVFLVVLILAVAFVAGRATLGVEIELHPKRVVAGNPTAGRVVFKNRSGRPITPLEVELPVGQGTATFRVPLVGPRASTEELFVVPTDQRGVIAIGPPTSVRSDPLGLFSRRAVAGDRTELIVHPVTVPLPPFGAGLLRDLEGLVTKEVSASDLAFHSLRDYTPADDHRFIHWRSSAKANKLQVRQFLDTSRSTLTVVLDVRPEPYSDPVEFEIAVQVAGSLVLRAARDQLGALVVAGGQAASSAVPYRLLDALARCEMDPSGPDLAEQCSRAAARAGDSTMAVLLTGSSSAPADLSRASLRFAPEVHVAAVLIRPDQPVSIGTMGRTTLIQLTQLGDLAAVLTSGAVA